MTSCKLVRAALIAGVLSGAAAADPPPVFTGSGYDDARKDARTAEKLFLVDATASWCGPCKLMDRTTWIDPRVVEWLGEHAVAVQLDVDRDRPHAKPLNIKAMPTIIVFMEGREFDRVVGYRTAEELLAWLDGVRAGRREIDALREAAGDRMTPDGRVDVQARYDLAETLGRTGQAEEAAAEFVWLWDNMLKHEPAMLGVRLSFMVGLMKRLAQENDVALAAFTKLRDRYAVKVENNTANRNDLNDWIHLNEVIDNEGATLRWFDTIKNDPKRRSSVNSIGRSLFPLLLESGRWTDAGRVYVDPVGQARQQVEMNEMMAGQGMDGIPEEHRAGIEQDRLDRFRQELSDLYAACLAADRRDEADQVAALLLAMQDDVATRVTLIKTVLRAEQPRREPHVRWLDEAEAGGEPVGDLRSRLVDALDHQRR